jgi:putative endonuclease
MSRENTIRGIASSFLLACHPPPNNDLKSLRANGEAISIPGIKKNEMSKRGFVYILTNKLNNVLYVGVTSNLTQRLHQHRTGVFTNSFTSKYNVNKLVYYEEFLSIEDAIFREKQLKAGSRKKKIELIEKMNKDWKDISVQYF